MKLNVLRGQHNYFERLIHYDDCLDLELSDVFILFGRCL